MWVKTAIGRANAQPTNTSFVLTFMFLAALNAKRAIVSNLPCEYANAAVCERSTQEGFRHGYGLVYPGEGCCQHKKLKALEPDGRDGSAVSILERGPRNDYDGEGL